MQRLQLYIYIYIQRKRKKERENPKSNLYFKPKTIHRYDIKSQITLREIFSTEQPLKSRKTQHTPKSNSDPKQERKNKNKKKIYPPLG